MKRLLIVMLLLANRLSAESPATVAFVVSARRHVHTISAGDLRRIYLGQITRWESDHHRIVLLVRGRRSVEEAMFLRRLIHMSDIDYAQWWIGAIFRGDAAAAPREIDAEEDLLNAVAANPDAIGFVLAPAVALHDVGVIAVDGKPPDDPRYPFAR